MTRGVVIALGVAAAVLGAIVFMMTRNQNPNGLRGGVPYYTPGAPNRLGGPPLPASNKASEYIQGVTATAKAAADAADSLTSLWEKTGKKWFNSDDSDGGTIDPDYVDSLPSIQS